VHFEIIDVVITSAFVALVAIPEIIIIYMLVIKIKKIYIIAKYISKCMQISSSI